MSDLLIRNIDDDTRDALARRASKNGRSRQSEALEILRDALLPERTTWVDLVLNNSRSVGGMEFEPPQRHSPRVTGIELDAR